MITATGVMAPLASNLCLHPVYLMLAIGCGSKTLPWTNDSGFRVISWPFSGQRQSTSSTMMLPLQTAPGLVR